MTGFAGKAQGLPTGRGGWWIAALTLALLLPAAAEVPNGGFESGDFTGWEADPNWVVVDNSCGYYSGWGGKWWAWSGGQGEPAMGTLISKPFVLDKDAVAMLLSGWSSVRGTGLPRRWNYVALELEDGTELDRVYAPDTTAFVPAWLDGTGHRGRRARIRAVDDADEPTFSMLCIDEVHTADLPAAYARPAPTLPPFDPRRSARLEDDRILIEVSRANGSITRVRDKVSGQEVILEPRLASSYRFSLPIPGKEPWQTIEANWVVGRDQRLTSCEVGAGRLTLRWAAPLRNYLGEPYDASATMTLELRDGGVLFRLHIANRTPYPVGETYFPIIGGMQGLGTTYRQLKGTAMVRPTADSVVAADIFRLFANASWLGDQGPEQYYAYPAGQPQPWVGFTPSRPGRSALVCALDPADRPIVLRLELEPASSGSTRDDGNWPRPEELNGLPVGVAVSFVDCAGGAAGQDYDAAPVLLRFVEGGATELRAAYEALAGL